MRTASMPRSWAGACTRKEGCIKPAGHKGACKLGAFEEEEFEVEKILEQRDGRGGQVEYLVKWVAVSYTHLTLPTICSV